MAGSLGKLVSTIKIRKYKTKHNTVVAKAGSTRRVWRVYLNKVPKYGYRRFLPMATGCATGVEKN